MVVVEKNGEEEEERKEKKWEKRLKITFNWVIDDTFQAELELTVEFNGVAIDDTF